MSNHKISKSKAALSKEQAAKSNKTRKGTEELRTGIKVA